MSELVRSSREGDRYHHLWGARYAIELIRPATTLLRVALEGPAAPTKSNPNADYAIDLALYWRGEADRENEELVQFKYSTRSNPTAISVSTIASVLTGWAGRIADADAGPNVTKLRVTSNRPFSAALTKARAVLAAGQPAHRQSKSVQKAIAKLRSATPRLSAAQRRRFFSMLEFDEAAEDADDLERAFRRTIAAHDAAPSTRRDKELALADLVEIKAGYKGRGNRNVIGPDDVLATLRVERASDLYPAPDAHEVAVNLIERSCTSLVAAQISSDERPCAVHAAGGLGKSELVRQLSPHLPSGSELVIFDGFGGGRYSQPDDRRHEHRRGILQIVNELAQRGLADLHLPSETLPASDWTREFRFAVSDAARELSIRDDGALLVMVLDAADNSVDAARAAASTTFVTDLLALSGLPSNIRLVATCRTERLDRLPSISTDRQIAVPAFDLEETRAHVHAVFPALTDAFIQQFLSRTGGNPRVQFFALQHAAALGDPNAVWQLVGDAPLAPQAALDLIFSKFVDEAGLRNGSPQRVQSILRAIATLPKPIPRGDLAAVADTPESEVDSCITDLRGMIANENTGISIRDEPTEFFLSENYGSATDRGASIAALTARRDISLYANLALPRLLLADGRRADVYALARDAHQPACITQEREWRRLRLARVRQALIAALRAREYGDASKLAAIGAVLAAEANEALAFITQSPELVCCAPHPLLVIDHVRRDFDPPWAGSRYTVLAALNAVAGNQGEAMVWFRRAMADIHAAIDARPRTRRRTDTYSVDDCANLALTLAEAASPSAAVKWISGWSPPLWAYRITRSLGDKACRIAGDLAEALAVIEADRLSVTLGLLGAMIASGLSPPPAAVKRLAEKLGEAGALLKAERDDFNYDEIRARESARADGLAIAEAALAFDRVSAEAIARAFAVVSPDTRTLRFPGSPVSGENLVFESVTLNCHVEGRAATAADFAGHLRETFASRKADDMPGATFEEWMDGTASYQARQFRAEISAAIKLYALRIQAYDPDNSDAAFATALAGLRSKDTFQGGAVENAIQRIQSGCCLAAAMRSRSKRAKLVELSAVANRMTIQERRVLISALGRAGADEEALKLASGYDWEDLEDTSARRSTMGEFAMAVRAVSEADAQALFSQGWDLKSGDDEQGDPRTIASLATALASQIPAALPGDVALGQRVADLIESAVIRTDVDKCPWSDFGRGMAALLQGDVFATISKWNDRGHIDLIYPLHLALTELVAREKISSLEAAALLRLRPVSWHWSYPPAAWVADWLAAAKTHKAETLSSLFRYWEDERDSSFDKEALAVFETHNNGLATPDEMVRRRLEARRLYIQLVESQKEDEPHLRHARAADEDERVEVAAAGVDPSSAASIDAASDALADSDGDRRLDHAMLDLIATRLKPGERRAFLEALLATRSVGRWAFEATIRRARENWSGVHIWMAPFLEGAAPQFASRVQMSADGDPWTVARALLDDLGLTDKEAAYRHTLDAFADAAADASSSALVSAAVIAAKLSPATAAEACAAVLTELPDQAGPTAAAVAPSPPGVGQIALFLWAQMGDWKAERRWEATASARELARLGQSGVFQELTLLWRTPPAGFVCDHLRFRLNDARHHLLIALESAVFDGGALNADAEALLKSCAMGGDDPHILFAIIAARTLLAIREAGRLQMDLTSNEVRHLETAANKSWPVNDKGEEFFPGRLDAPGEDAGNFHFDHDFVEGYLDAVCDGFSIERADLAPRVVSRVRRSWPELTNSRQYEEWRSGAYEDFHTNYGSGPPKQSSIGFSAAFHALCEEAGELTRSRPITNPAQWPNRWNEWLEGFDRAYPKGWISDHEGSAPFNIEVRGGRPDYSTKTTDEWPWVFDAAQFERCLQPHDRPGALCVAASWSLTRNSNSLESITIESALIASSDARNVMAALQHVDTQQWRLPTGDDPYRWRMSGLPAIQPMLERVSVNGRLEEWYPRAHAGHEFYRLIGPAAAELEPHSMSEIWSNNSRLTCDRAAIVDYLRQSGNALVVSVLVGRPGKGDYEGGRSARFARVFVLSADDSLSFCTSVEPSPVQSTAQTPYGIEAVRIVFDAIGSGSSGATFRTVA